MEYEVIIKEASEGFLGISLDAWIQTLGSLVGAFLAGFFAIYVFYKQRSEDEKRKFVLEKELFLRKYYELINALSMCDILVDILLGEYNLLEDGNKDINKYLENLKSNTETINNIEDNSIPLVFMEKYYDVKRGLNGTEILINHFHDLYVDETGIERIISEGGKRIIREQIEKERNKLKSFIKELKKYAEQVQAELLKK